MVEINEDTKLPARMVWSALGVVVGGTIWLTTMFVHQQATASRVQSIESTIERIDTDRLKKREEFTDFLHRIDNRLSRIEGKLNIHK